ncbi:DUF2480 family protein [Leptobacterium sp. I13]|uniref:DUF2480 family protein n=1 Tax=Leptobacterium meishanense TaxID=3128904 RepID=UPI0030ED0499
MAEEIKNRVAQSKLITFDLEEYYPEGKRVLFDIKDWLYEGLILKEKEFRQHAKEHNWEQYKNSYIALTCSTEAIVPAWAYMLLATYLTPYAKKNITGDLALLETILYKEIIEKLDVSPYENLPIIIKGCSKKPVPQNAYIMLIEKLQPVAKSILYGEACSSVPLIKKK